MKIDIPMPSDTDPYIRHPLGQARHRGMVSPPSS